MWFPRRRRRPRHDLAALDRLSETIARAVALIEERVASTPAPPKPRPTGDLVIRRETRWPEPAPRLRERGRERDDEREQPAEPGTPPAPVAVAEPEPTPAQPVAPTSVPTLPSGFVLFVPTAAGYRLAGPDGLVPKPGERLRVDDEWYRVLRLGPSPLPADRRRCVFLEATLD